MNIMFRCPNCRNEVYEHNTWCDVCGQSLEEYVRYYKSAQRGDAYSQYALGVLYRNGIYVDFDYEKSFYWTKKAAEAGITNAQGALGGMYLEGNGTSRDLTKAFYWTEKAAKAGNTHAKHELGCYYLNGEGTSQNAIRAIYWFLEARKEGDTDAANVLRQLGIADGHYLNEDSPLHIQKL